VRRGDNGLVTTLTSEQILDNVRSLGPLIESVADDIERDRRLPDELVEAMRSAGVFRIAFPKAWGGPEMGLIDQSKLIETLSYHDASTAWVAMICSDSGHYAARLEESIAKQLYPSLDLLTSGYLFPAGRARAVEGGFRVSGRWQFGSGCLHADHLLGGCMVFDGGTPRFAANGIPEMMAVWLPREHVTIHDTWHTTGLAGSGSNDYSADDVFVPAGHHFHPFLVGTRPEPLYRYHGLFFVNLPAVSIGCAQRMLDDLRALAETKISVPSMTAMKDEYRVQLALTEGTAAIGAARAYQDDVLGSIWRTLLAGDSPTMEQRASISLMSVHAIRAGHEVAESVCEVVGGEAIYRRSPFDRRRRDLATVTAHVIGQRKTLASAAQLLFGDEPSFSFV
jgi:alkylation response protein AidB-like acyl-CoA dehydrogenase